MEELKKRIKVLINKKKDLLAICKELELKDYEVIGLIELMKQDGEMIDYINGEIVKIQKPLKENDVYEIPSNLEHLKLLLISDTHLCSKYDRLDILNYLYAKAEDEGVKHILHCGDFTDGRSNRPEQVYELREPSYEGQIQYCVDKYPKFSGKTYAISGNHDNWWVKKCGGDIMIPISKQREDIIYLGPDVADLKIGKVKIRMFHGKGGSSYAKSYKIQKYLDAIPSKEKPDIFQSGHTHNSFYMLQDGINCFQTGCLEDNTPFIRSIGLNNEKSCWWVDVDLDDKGKVYKITPKIETFGNKVKRRR